MKLNRKWLLLVALVLSVAMATTGTLAYLTDEDKDINTMTLGKVEIVQNEQERTDHGLDEFTQDKPLYPAVYEGTSIPWADENDWVQQGNQAWKVVEDNANVVDKFVTVTNIGKSNAYVRTIIAYEGDETYGPEGAYIHIVHNGDNVNPVIEVEKLGVMNIGGVDYTVYSYTYPEVLVPDQTTIPSLKQVYMDKSADNDVVAQYGEKYDILVLSQAVQAKGFEGLGEANGTTDAKYALNEAFGEVTEEKLNEWLADTEIGSPNDKYPDEGKNDTNNPPSPFAKVTTLGANDTLTNADGDVVVVAAGRTIDTTDSKMGYDAGVIPLDVVYQFEPTISADEVQNSEYKYWHADFVVKANKEIPAYGIGLAGYYDAWCSLNDYKWVLLADGGVIPANTEIRLVQAMGGGSITVNYEDICTFGNDGIGFLCGAVALNGKTIEGVSSPIDAQLEPGTTITVELRLYETKNAADTETNTKNEETGNYITTGVYTYTFN